MSKYGIEGKILDWVKDFINGITQRVVIREKASTPRNVTSGVPQGSVLEPILFLIFINELPLGVLSPLSLFADESKLFSRIVTSRSKRKFTGMQGSKALQDDLNKVREWGKKLKMEFNVDKCKIVHLGHSNTRNIYNVDAVNNKVKEEEKDLGVLIRR